jgi:hypothetical protein
VTLPQDFEVLHGGRVGVIRRATRREYLAILIALTDAADTAVPGGINGDYSCLQTLTPDTLAEWLTPDMIMVRTDYMSDGPGFAGKLAVIFWGEPELFTVLGDNGSTNTNWEVITPEK